MVLFELLFQHPAFVIQVCDLRRVGSDEAPRDEMVPVAVDDAPIYFLRLKLAQVTDGEDLWLVLNVTEHGLKPASFLVSDDSASEAENCNKKGDTRVYRLPVCVNLVKLVHFR